MLGSAAFGIYPYVLPAIDDPGQGLTIYNTASSPHALTVALFWFIPGMLLVIAYTVFAHKKVAGRIGVEDVT
jgi:cytochrome d ubiquinol oxidase subunit II